MFEHGSNREIPTGKVRANLSKLKTVCKSLLRFSLNLICRAFATLFLVSCVSAEDQLAISANFDIVQASTDALELTFRASDYADTYRWIVDNSAVSENQEMSYRFSKPGSYEVTLTTSRDSQETTVTKAIGVPLGGQELSGRIALRNDILQIGQAKLRDATVSPLDEPNSVTEVMITFRNTLEPPTRLITPDFYVDYVRPLPISRFHLYRAKIERPLTSRDLEALGDIQNVLNVSPNRLLTSSSSPNDVYYLNQWNLSTVGLPIESSIVKGLEPATVAVVDTGILYDIGNQDLKHPDLPISLLPGYDFISDAARAQDGDGRDNNPFDPGNFFENANHGSHVAGIVAAATDNKQGISGASNAQLLIVRALNSENSGVESDVLDGIAWAAGLPVEGVPLNENPADIINLSLGVNGPCSEVQRQLFSEIAQRGILVVAAAGNANANVNNLAPANCANVIAVGATDFRGYRANYSNYGAGIDIMAPGGNSQMDRSGDGLPDGILSLGLDLSGEFGYSLIAGTSMASPHVGALLAAMKTLEPDLRPEQALNILSKTASPLSTTECKGSNQPNLSGADCGAGLMNAERALRQMSGSPVTPLLYSPPTVNFTPDERVRTLKLKNPTSSPISWNLAGSKVKQQIEFTPRSGILPAFQSVEVELSLGAGFDITEVVDFSINLSANGQTEPVQAVASPLTALTVPTSLQGISVIACLWQSNACAPTGSQVHQLPVDSTEANFALSRLEAGDYTIYAWKDVNRDNEVSVGDLLGMSDKRVTPPNSEVSLNVEIVLPDTQMPMALKDFLANR